MSVLADARVLATITRLWPEFVAADDTLAADQSDEGAMIGVYVGPAHTLAGRIFVDALTSTIYRVPSWASSLPVMCAAVADPGQRARLSVVGP